MFADETQHTVVQGGDMQEDEVAVAEMRVRLLAGLTRYLHGKRLNGLLSSQRSLCKCSSLFRCSLQTIMIVMRKTWRQTQPVPCTNICTSLTWLAP